MKNLRILILFSLILLAGSVTSSFAANYIIQKLSTDNYPAADLNYNTMISDNGHVAWVRVRNYWSNNTSEIFYYDGTATIQLTNNNFRDTLRFMNANGQVVWSGYDGLDEEIFLYDGTTTIQLTNNIGYNDYPGSLSENGHVAWQGYDGQDYEIFVYDGTSTTQITNNTIDDTLPQVNDNGQVTWYTWDGVNYDVFFYDGTTTTQLTNSTFHGLSPRLSANGHVMFLGYTGTVYSETNDIYYFDGTTTTRITNNSPNINTLGGMLFDNGNIVWLQYDQSFSLYNLFYYNGTTTTQISNNTLRNNFLYIDDSNASGHVVWDQFNGRDDEIFLYDGTTTTQLTNTPQHDNYPRINNKGYVVWESHGGSDAEVLVYDGTTTIALTSGLLFHDVHPAINNRGDIAWMKGGYSYGYSDRYQIYLATLQNQPPVANAGLGEDIFLGETVYFDGAFSSDPDGGPIVSYTWAIDSAPAGPPLSVAALNGADTVTPSFKPDLLGEYIISLVVNDGIYNSAADTVIVNVTENLPPVAIATAVPATGFFPLGVSLDASTSSDPEGGVLTYSWDFGDSSAGAAGVAQNHTYMNVGTYTAIVTVTDDFGLSNQASAEVVVSAPNKPPTVAPAASTYNGAAPLNVQFMANGSDHEGDTLSYLWDFGDGTISTEASPLHTYTTPGAFVATVNVSDYEFTATGSITISVSSPLTCNVKEAKTDKGKKGKVKGKVNLKASFTYPTIPGPLDQITATFDGITLVSALFSAFKEDGDDPGEFKYKDENLHMKIDFNKMTIKISRHKMVLTSLDNSSGIDVVISFGNATCTDHFVMKNDDDEDDEEEDHEKKMSHKEKDDD